MAKHKKKSGKRKAKKGKRKAKKGKRKAKKAKKRKSAPKMGKLSGSGHVDLTLDKISRKRVGRVVKAAARGLAKKMAKS